MSDKGERGWLRGLFRKSPDPEPQSPAPLPPSLRAAPVPPPRPLGPPPTEPLAAPPGNTAFTAHTLRSLAGRHLAVASGGTRLTTVKTADIAQSVCLIVPQAQPWIALLAAQDARRIGTPGDPITGPGLSARLLHSTRRDIIRLKQPLGGTRFLIAVDPAPEIPEDDLVRFDGSGNTAAAAWQLSPADMADLSLGLRSLATEFAGAINAGLRQSHLIELLRSGALRPELAEPVFRLLPRDELHDLSRRLLDEPDTQALLAKCLPRDRFLTQEMPKLISWRITRGPLSANGEGQSPGADEPILAPCMNEATATLGLALQGLARSQIAPRKGACLLASARNEGPYLLEWLAYHLSIGFEHAYIYSNDNSDGSDELLAQLARHGVITHIRNERGPRIGPQEKAYAHALTMLPQILDYRWTAVLDFDEYLGLDAAMFGGIGDFIGLHEAQTVDAIALCWLIYGSSFGEPYRPGLTIERFPLRHQQVNGHVKSLFRTRLFWGSQPHYPYPVLEAPFIFRSQDGGIHHHPGVQTRIPAFAEKPAASQAWVNHYIFRTAPEALWKAARGSAAWSQEDGDTLRQDHTDFIFGKYLEFASRGVMVEDRRLLACAVGQAKYLEKLLALPGVSEAHAAIMENFDSKLKTLTESFLETALPHAAPPVRHRFREALAQSQGVIHQNIYAPTTPVV
jgi:hypothetical protein